MWAYSGSFRRIVLSEGESSEVDNCAIRYSGLHIYFGLESISLREIDFHEGFSRHLVFRICRKAFGKLVR